MRTVGSKATKEACEERVETIESNMSDLSPHSKEKRKIAKHIQRSFRQTKEAPVTTTEFYRIGKMLGKGAFGKVNLAIHKLTDKVGVRVRYRVVRRSEEHQQDVPL